MQTTLRVLLILQCVTALARANVSDQELQKWVDNSTLIFTGTLVAPGSNVSGIDSKDAMLVKVESVQASNEKALAKFGSLVGMELTVVVDPSSRIQQPRRGIPVKFFVNPLMYESNIAVTAYAIADEKTAVDLSKRIAEDVQRKNERPFKEAVASSDLIVTGTVKEIRSLPETKLTQLRSFANGRDIFSEHSPRWKEAVILVHSVLKGDLGEKMALAIFPSTDDRMWTGSPRFEKDQTGIWLLHGNEITKAESGILLAPEKFDGRAIKAYTTLNPEDFQPNDPGGKNEARIREILKALKP
jgi:hypothetical protein